MRKWNRLRTFVVFDAPVFIHWGVIPVLSALLLFGFWRPLTVGVAIAAYLSIIFVHECGHAAIARYLGYQVIAIRLAALHGFCEHEPPHDEWDDVRIAWGGVAAQIAVALVVLAIAALVGHDNIGLIAPVMVVLGYINVAVAAMNLMPVSPFDGSRAWRIFPLLLKRARAKRRVKAILRDLTPDRRPPRDGG